MNKDCAPCKQIIATLPLLLSKLDKEVKVLYQDTYKDNRLAEKYKVWTQPCSILFKDRKELYRHEGAYLEINKIAEEINVLL